jgi:plastocyanin
LLRGIAANSATWSKTMPTRFARLSALLVLSLGATAAAATDHVVSVSDGLFEPKNITISVGDTVTFKAFGNAYPHNVHDVDDSFRCSRGCRGDSSGATGDPVKEWTATVAFNVPKLITYQCDPHAIYGMSGTINVVAAAPGLTLRPGLSGNWYDPTPNQGGHGFQLEFLPDHGILALWFVFNPAGTSQAWIYSQGSYDPTHATVTVPSYLEQGGAFPPNFNSNNLTAQPWGSLEFSFSDCSSGSVTWHANATAAAAGYADRTFPIKRLTNIDTLACP